MTRKMTPLQSDRAEWYDRESTLPNPNASDAKVTAKGKGQLESGYSTLKIPPVKPAYNCADDFKRIGKPWRPKGAK